MGSGQWMSGEISAAAPSLNPNHGTRWQNCCSRGDSSNRTGDRAASGGAGDAGRRDLSELRQAAELLAEEVRGIGPRAIAVQSALSTDDEVSGCLQAIDTSCGSIYALINLASDYEKTPLETLDAAAWDAGMAAARVDYLLSLHAARRMRLNPGPTRGQILKFGDWAAGETPYRNYLPYLTAKAAIQFMTRAWRSNWRGMGFWSTRLRRGRQCDLRIFLLRSGLPRLWPAPRSVENRRPTTLWNWL